jgi:hypothetical protein
MSAPTRTLPTDPNLEHLRRQAHDLQRDHRDAVPQALERIRAQMSGLGSASDAEVAAAPIPRTAAQLVIAREYGFANWPDLVAAVEAVTDKAVASASQDSPVKAAIDSGDATALGQLLEQQPDLLDASFEWIDRKKRVRSITPIRYAHGQGAQTCIDALLAAGASLDFLGTELWNNIHNANLPQVKRLLAVGVSPGGLRTACGHIGPVRHDLVNTLIEAGVEWEDGPVMDMHRGDLAALERRLDKDSTLVRETFEDTTGGMRLACTLLHIAASRNDVAAIELLLRHGADVNAHAPEDWKGLTPIFLTLVRGITPTPTQEVCADACRDAFEALIAAGADLSLSAKCRIAHFEVWCTPLAYALTCQEAVQRGKVLGSTCYADGTYQIERLRELGAPE